MKPRKPQFRCPRSPWLVLALLATQCVPEPKRQACRIDVDCPDAEHGRAYCVQSRCVECITRASCGAHMTCVKGECVPKK